MRGRRLSVTNFARRPTPAVTVREVALEAYREALPVLALSAVGGLFAGVVLGGIDAIPDVAGLRVASGAARHSRGRLRLARRTSGVGASSGLINPRFSFDDDRINAAVAAALAIGVLISGVAAVMAVALLALVGRPSAPLTTLVAIALIAGLVSGLPFYRRRLGRVRGYRRGRNPDTLAGPIVTTTGDVFGIATLLGAFRLVLAIGGRCCGVRDPVVRFGYRPGDASHSGGAHGNRTR